MRHILEYIGSILDKPFEPGEYGVLSRELEGSFQGVWNDIRQVLSLCYDRTSH